MTAGNDPIKIAWRNYILARLAIAERDNDLITILYCYRELHHD